MQRGFQTEIRRIVLLGLVLSGVGYINHQLLLTLVCGGGLYMAWTLRHILRLYRWLESSRTELPPEASGVWGDISDQLYRMQQKNRRAIEAQRSTLTRIQSITSALDEGLVILNNQRELDWWNPAAALLLNLQAKDQRQPISNLIRSPSFIRFIQGKSFKNNLEMPAPNDDQRKLLVSAALFGNNNLALVVRDITQLRNMEQMRTDFVANVSHELRTPLTVLSGYIETLQDAANQLPASWPNALEQMAQQTQRMNSLADDLLLLSRLETMKEKPSKKPVALQPLLEQIQQDALSQIGALHRLQLVCEPALAINGEAKELYSAFTNLVFNAIKHNPQGADIEICAEGGNGVTTVTVRDNGVGIDSKHIGRLTERFYRAEQSRALQTGGTGLGLAIVKHVMLRHHGTLSIRSSLGNGSTFICRFAN